MWVTLNDANSWLEARGYGEIEQEELQLAQDYIDAVYGHRFVGTPIGNDTWPRKGATDCYGNSITEAPDAVKAAVYLAAHLGLASSTISLPTGATSITEGALSIGFGSGGAKTGAGFVTNPMIDSWLGCYLHKSVGIRLV